MEKFIERNHFSPVLSMIAIPEMHMPSGKYNKTILGMNPSVSDYSALFKDRDIVTQLWYFGALASNTDLESNSRLMILKTLAGTWRMVAAGSIRVPIGYIAEIAKRINANIDEILSSSFSLKMSNVSWALKDMSELHALGMLIGPITTHMISVYVIKHAQKSQSITGLQKMVGVINGN
jgi:hypothetical protein